MWGALLSFLGNVGSMLGNVGKTVGTGIANVGKGIGQGMGIGGGGGGGGQAGMEAAVAPDMSKAGMTDLGGLRKAAGFDAILPAQQADLGGFNAAAGLDAKPAQMTDLGGFNKAAAVGGKPKTNWGYEIGKAIGTAESLSRPTSIPEAGGYEDMSRRGMPQVGERRQIPGIQLPANDQDAIDSAIQRYMMKYQQGA